MNKAFQRFSALSLPEGSQPAALLILCLTAYGLLIPYLGFYWDDFPLAWISQKLGPEGIARYFSTNRPFWGSLYQLTTPVFGSEPILWQIFAIFWRWAAAVALWALLRQVWPHVPQIAAWTSLLFVVYPGFGQQFIALVYSHFLIVLTAFFISLFLNILALRRPKYSWPLTGLALLLSLGNLLAMEYFFLLELIRPLLLWWVLAESHKRFQDRLKHAIFNWLPYLAVFIGAAFWRVFFFSFQTQNYQPLLLEELRNQPFQTLLKLAGVLVISFWDVTVAAWLRAFSLPNPTELGLRTSLLYVFLVLGTLALAGAYLFKFRAWQTPPSRSTALAVVFTGAVGYFIAGWPFWLIGMRPSLNFPLDRFTLPFALGVCLLVVGLLLAIPLREWMRLAAVGLLLAFAAGYQFQLGNQYRRDWETQKRFFWQLSWRIPNLQVNTTLLVNDLPVTFYSDNSLTAPLNWLYASENTTEQMSFLLYYPSVRFGGSLSNFPKDTAIELDYLAASFSGSTSQMVAVYYEPPACLRVLDAQVDSRNRMLPEPLRQAALLSSTSPVLPGGSPISLPEHLFGPEPAHNWCYYFARADLARQKGDWEKVTALGDEAFSLGDYPNDPSERMPFIEGYAQVGNWDRALQLSAESARITPLMQAPLCRLWERIAETTSSSPEKKTALAAVASDLSCSP